MAIICIAAPMTGTTMIMVTITHRMQIDWKAWQEKVTQIASLMV